jgi:hypothetical protein
MKKNVHDLLKQGGSSVSHSTHRPLASVPSRSTLHCQAFPTSACMHLLHCVTRCSYICLHASPTLFPCLSSCTSALQVCYKCVTNVQAQEARQTLELRVAALEAVVASLQPAAADAPAAADEVVVAVAEPVS